MILVTHAQMGIAVDCNFNLFQHNSSVVVVHVLAAIIILHEKVVLILVVNAMMINVVDLYMPRMLKMVDQFANA